MESTLLLSNDLNINNNHWSIAQLVERTTHIRYVVGSNPTRPIIKSSYITNKLRTLQMCFLFDSDF